MTRLRKAETPQDLQKQCIGHSVCGRRPHVDGSGLDQLAYNLKIGPNGVIADHSRERRGLYVLEQPSGRPFSTVFTIWVTTFTAFYSFVTAV